MQGFQYDKEGEESKSSYLFLRVRLCACMYVFVKY